MRKISVFSFLFVLSITGFAQNNYIKDSTLTSNWNTATQSYNPATQKIEYHYNPNGTTNNLEIFKSVGGVWRNSELQYFGYDNNGRQIAFYGLVWDTIAHNWISNQYDSLTYNSAGKLIRQSTYLWNTGNNSWNLKHLQIFNSHGAITEEILYEIDLTSFDVKSGNRDMYSYNSSQRNTTVTSDTLNSVSMNWQKESFLEKEYIADTIFAAYLNSTWNGVNYIPSTSDTMIYQSGNMVSRLEKTYNGTTWTNSYKLINTYNLNHQLINFLEQHYLNNNWVDFGKTTLTYTPSGKIENSQSDVFTSGQWVINSVFHNEYDVTDSISSFYNRHFINGSGGWGTKNTYTRNSNHYATNVTIQNWDPSLSVWANNFQVDYYYSVFNIGIPEYQSFGSLCYPNPVNAGSYLHCTFIKPEVHYNYTLSGIQGNTIFSKSIRGDEEIQIPSDLIPGLYFLRITDDKGINKSGKISVQ